MCKLQDEYKDLLEATRLLVFFGAPHNGLRTEELEAMVDDLKFPSAERLQKLLKQLQEHSRYLQEHSELCVQLLKDFKIISFHETMLNPVVRKVFQTVTSS